MSNLLIEIALSQTPKIGPVTYHSLLETYGTVDEAFQAVMQNDRFQIKPCLKRSEALVKNAEKQNVKILSLHSQNYPAALRQIHDAPPILFVRGNQDLLEKNCIAMVGARVASFAGQKLAYAMAADLSERGYVMVSGFAKGIDHAVHKGAERHGSIAVFAGGVDQVFPSEFEKYAATFLETGVIISEQPLGLKPFQQSFPRRNRLISGLSRMVVVVEAAYQSGSLLTADYAAHQGRDVAAVPGSPLDPRCRGTNKLLKDGAHLVENSWDILAALQDLSFAEKPKEETPVQAKTETTESLANEVLALLNYSFVDLNDLLRQIPTETQAVLEIVSSLELAGRIIRNANNQIALRPE